MCAGAPMPPDVTLITFPPSLDCELGRFLLGHYGVAYREQPHALVFSSVVALLRAGVPVFPVAFDRSVRLSTVRAIVDHYDPLCAADRRLLPDGSTRAQAEADFPAFRWTLATDTAVFSYFHLLPHPPLMAGPLSDGAPAFERRFVAAAYPLFSGLLRLLLGITPARARAGLDATRRAMQAVAGRLSDGRPYLLGDRFSLSDMTFAVAIAPLVLPEAYAGRLPPLSEMPIEMRTAVAEMREHPAGRFALRVYRDHRPEGARREEGGAVT
jgi:glutathione S-transferase